MAETKRWLRNIKDGEIYGWNEILAENPLTEEVTEEQAFPEKHMPKKQKGRPPKVNVETDIMYLMIQVHQKTKHGLKRSDIK